MKLQIQSVHFHASSQLQEFVTARVNKLETFFDHIIGGDVFLRLEKGDNTRENKAVEIKLHLPGTTLFSKHRDTSFEAAADHAIESLRRQVKKYKDKHRQH